MVSDPSLILRFEMQLSPSGKKIVRLAHSYLWQLNDSVLQTFIEYYCHQVLRCEYDVFRRVNVYLLDIVIFFND